MIKEKGKLHMNAQLKKLEEKVMNKEEISKEEALSLLQVPVEELCNSANRIREAFCKNTFDMCTIINGKCGRCSEDCKYCAQSGHYHTNCQDSYPLLDTETILKEAKYNAGEGFCATLSSVQENACLLPKSIRSVKVFVPFGNR